MPTFSEKLLRAKVPQLLGTYLAVGFGLLQFVEFISNRYAFSSIWVDRYLLFWLGLIPAVALVIYYRGLPRKSESSGASWKTGLIFANLFIVGALVFLLTDEVAADTEKVAFVDEEGVEQERVIPAGSAVQKIGVFPLENSEGVTDKNDWWGVAYSLLLDNSLRQRPEVITTNPISLVAYYERFGAMPYEEINLATKRRIAEEVGTNYFIALEHLTETHDDNYVLRGGMYQTSDGQKVLELEAVSDRAFQAVDLIKEQIDGFLPALPEEGVYTSNLTSAALLTDSEAALEAFTRGLIAFDLRPDDLETAINYFQTSVAEDPSCAVCSYALGDKYYGQGKIDSAKTYFRQAVRLAEVLPERDQFMYKFILLQINQQHEATAKIMESYRALYPYDFIPYQALENYYTSSYGIDSTISLMLQAAEISDRQSALSRLYDLYNAKEDFANAEQIMETSQEEFPDEDVYRIRRAFLYQETGRIDEARELLREMMILDPLNVDPLYQLSKLEIRLGNYEVAEGLLRDMLEQSTTITDSTNAFNSLTVVHSNQGRIEEARKNLDDYEVFISRSAPINRIKMGNFYYRLDLAMKVNDEAGIQEAYQSLVPYDADYARLYECLVPYMAIVYNYDGITDANRKIRECSATLESLGTMYIAYNEFSRAFYSGDYAATADLIEEKQEGGIDVAPSVVDIRINRLAGRYEKARELLEKELTLKPGRPDLLLEKAYLENELGNPEVAINALQRVQEIYRDADPDFVPAQRARALLLELNGG